MPDGSKDLPTIGLPIVTVDGEQVGTVKEVDGSHFKVDAALAADYWLDVGVIATTSSGLVRLKLTKGQLEGAKRAGPAHRGANPEVGTA